MRNAGRLVRGAVVVIGALLLVQCNPPTEPSGVTEPTRQGRGGKKVQPTLESPAPTSTPTQDGVEIEIEDGEVIGPVEITVDRGQTMVLEIKADVEDRVVVEGYQVVVDVGPDRDALFQFDATLPGLFDITLERSGLLVTRLRVK